MIRSELKQQISQLLQDQLEAGRYGAEATTDMILSIPHLKEALDFYEKSRT